MMRVSAVLTRSAKVSHGDGEHVVFVEQAPVPSVPHTCKHCYASLHALSFCTQSEKLQACSTLHCRPVLPGMPDDQDVIVLSSQRLLPSCTARWWCKSFATAIMRSKTNPSRRVVEAHPHPIQCDLPKFYWGRSHD